MSIAGTSIAGTIISLAGALAAAVRKPEKDEKDRRIAGLELELKDAKRRLRGAIVALATAREENLRLRADAQRAAYDDACRQMEAMRERVCDCSPPGRAACLRGQETRIEELEREDRRFLATVSQSRPVPSWSSFFAPVSRGPKPPIYGLR